MNRQDFEDHSLWWDTLVSLDMGGSGEDLVLPRLGIPDFADVPGEAFPPLMSRWGWAGEKWRYQRRRGRGN